MKTQHKKIFILCSSSQYLE